jgi:ADP-ribose pyrophosphatase YjhB (NUDIX family)
MSESPGRFNHCPFCGEKLTKKMVDEKNRPYCKACERVIWRNPVPSAAVAVKKESQVLMIKRGIEPWKGKWSLPAGFIEMHEDPEIAAIREVEEETSIKARKEKIELFDTLSFKHDHKEHVIVQVYVINIKNTEGNPAPSSDAEKLEFWSQEDLEKNKDEVRTDYYDLIKQIIQSN